MQHGGQSARTEKLKTKEAKLCGRKSSLRLGSFSHGPTSFSKGLNFDVRYLSGRPLPRGVLRGMPAIITPTTLVLDGPRNSIRGV